MKKRHAHTENDTTRFADLAKRLFAVPKKQVEVADKKWREDRAKKKQLAKEKASG